MKRLLRMDEAAEMLGISQRTLYRMLGDGTIPGGKVRGGIRIDIIDIEAYITQIKEDFSKDFGFSLSNHDRHTLNDTE